MTVQCALPFNAGRERLLILTIIAYYCIFVASLVKVLLVSLLVYSRWLSLMVCTRNSVLSVQFMGALTSPNKNVQTYAITSTLSQAELHDRSVLLNGILQLM